MVGTLDLVFVLFASVARVASDVPVAPSLDPLPAQPATMIEGVTTDVSSGTLAVTLDVDGRLVYKTLRLDNPKRLVFDFPTAYRKVKLQSLPVDAQGVKTVRIAQFQLEPAVTRLVFDLAGDPRPYLVSQKGRRFEIRFEPPAAAALVAMRTPDPPLPRLESSQDSPSSSDRRTSSSSRSAPASKREPAAPSPVNVASPFDPNPSPAAVAPASSSPASSSSLQMVDLPELHARVPRPPSWVIAKEAQTEGDVLVMENAATEGTAVLRVLPVPLKTVRDYEEVLASAQSYLSSLPGYRALEPLRPMARERTRELHFLHVVDGKSIYERVVFFFSRDLAYILTLGCPETRTDDNTADFDALAQGLDIGRPADELAHAATTAQREDF